jgi:acyl-CoA synthetase (AMP-forming)/AMP-acid ligase II
MHAVGSLGPILDRMQYRIVDPETREPVPTGTPGDLCVRGPWLMDGFYKRLGADIFDADGFYPTGDKCHLDENGYLYFHGRLGGMIKTAGANVSPEEVENVIAVMDDVLEVAVFGVKDAQLDQMVVAVVAIAADSKLDEEGLKERLRGQLSSFKVPKRVFFMDFEELPRTPSKKIRKPALAEIIKPLLGKG